MVELLIAIFVLVVVILGAGAGAGLLIVQSEGQVKAVEDARQVCLNAFEKYESIKITDMPLSDEYWDGVYHVRVEVVKPTMTDPASADVTVHVSWNKGVSGAINEITMKREVSPSAWQNAGVYK